MKSILDRRLPKSDAFFASIDEAKKPNAVWFSIQRPSYINIIQINKVYNLVGIDDGILMASTVVKTNKEAEKMFDSFVDLVFENEALAVFGHIPPWLIERLLLTTTKAIIDEEDVDIDDLATVYTEWKIDGEHVRWCPVGYLLSEFDINVDKDDLEYDDDTEV